MQIKSIQHQHLQAYIDSEEYKSTAHIAISKHRALSHIRNPRAKTDDLVLVLIYENEEMVAYLGVFADDLHFKDGLEHVGWLSCMWVNPKMRGKGVAKRLINTVFEAWDYKILVTEFTPAAAGLYKRTGQFIDLANVAGKRAYLRLNLAYLLPQKKPTWRPYRWLLKGIDAVFKVPNWLRLKRHRYRLPLFEYLIELDKESSDFIQQFKAAELLKRSEKDINWLLNNPWLIAAPMHDDTAARYSFTARADRFQFLTIKAMDAQKKITGLMVLSIKGRQLKIPYFYCKKGSEKQMMDLIYHHMIIMGLDMLTVYHAAVVKQLTSEKHPFFLVRDFERRYIIGKVLEEKLLHHGAFTLQDGDADAAFT